MIVMPATLPAPAPVDPRLRLENVSLRQAKADLKNRDEALSVWRTRVGAAFRRAVEIATVPDPDGKPRGISKKEAAALLDRDAAQIARWIAGTERVQLDAVMAVDALRGPFVLALATLADDIEVATTLTLRRLA